MSDSNGYDCRGEDEALRHELAELVEHQARSDQRLTTAASGVFATMDRLSVSLGRIDAIEQEQRRHGRLLDAIAARVGAIL